MKITDEKTLQLSVRELVEFVLREGDIDNRRTGPALTDAMLIGTMAHQKIQRSMGEDYEAEVSLKYLWSYNGGISLSIEGRADGIITDYNGKEKEKGAYTIDEIKGIFRDVERMEKPVGVHLAQAEMYAFILTEMYHLPRIAVQVTYVQLDINEKTQQLVVLSDKIHRFVFEYSCEEIRKKAEEYTGLFEKWASFVIDHRQRRKESADGFPFPYPEYRPGQKKIISQVYKTVREGKRLFVQAPTGIGKTLSMLYPAVRALGEGLSDKIFYLTAKTVTSNVAEEGMRLMDEKGLLFSYIKITAKEKMCPLEMMHCDPVNCERAKGHFSRINEAVYDLITHERCISSEKISEYALKHRVCPYEMSLDVSLYTDVIIADYNYAFAPHVRLQRYFGSGSKQDHIFLMDEAHNLVDRARDMYSAALVKEDVLQAKKFFKDQKGILKQLEKVNKQLLSLKRECDGKTVFTEETFPNVLLFDLMALKERITKYLDRNPNAPEMEEILNFYFEVSDFLDTADHLYNGGYLSYASFDEKGAFFLRLFCIDPSVRLKELLDNVTASVFFSATFLPINYYKELLTGDKDEMAMYVDSPFEQKNRRILVGKDVSSKYTRRNYQEYKKIAEYLLHMIKGARGNYLAFFPSHKYLEEVGEVLKEYQDKGEDFELIFQKRSMKEEERKAFLDRFEEKTEHSLLGLSVMGGVFSEGIDLRHDRLIGVAVVGTGLPQVCVERELIKQFYQDRGENGFDYAYRYPGFNKVMQAAGRLIRTKEDRGIILLLDERFIWNNAVRLFPKEWSDYMITDSDRVFQDVSDFWE